MTGAVVWNHKHKLGADARGAACTNTDANCGFFEYECTVDRWTATSCAVENAGNYPDSSQNAGGTPPPIFSKTKRTIPFREARQRPLRLPLAPLAPGTSPAAQGRSFLVRAATPRKERCQWTPPSNFRRFEWELSGKEEGARFRENNLQPILSMDQRLRRGVANELKA